MKRLKALELAVLDDPLSRDPGSGEGSSRIKPATASWPAPKPGDRKAGSKGGKPGTRTYRGPKR